MTTSNHHIVFIEPSSVIYEGINVILGNSDQHFNITRLERIEDIPGYSVRKAIDIVMVNPGQVQNNLKTFNTITDSLPQTKWIGIVYSYFDPHLLSLFDDIIGVADTPESIISLVNRVAEPHEEEQVHQERLTEREIEVLKLLTAGNSNKEIADQLNISIHTVISHRKNLSQKTGIKSVSGLTIYAVVKNIITLDSFKE
jgi:DNA-binding CsgD family transcriptional regulator